jgi:hypothetical protein
VRGVTAGRILFPFQRSRSGHFLSLSPHALNNFSQDDCIIEIFFDVLGDSIGMAIECHSDILTDSQANKLVKEWASVVNNVLDHP